MSANADLNAPGNLLAEQGGPSAAQLSGIILAAGFSRRSWPVNKLLVSGEAGKPVLRSVAEAFCEAGLGEVIVVLGHQQEAVAELVVDLPLRLVQAHDYAGGMGHSLAAGVSAARADARGFLISPGDLPGMKAGIVREVAEAFVVQAGEFHIIPMHEGQRGHPVALAADLRGSLETLTGDQGARQVLSEEKERVRCVLFPMESDAICRDNDRG